jgi:hypothetical protein
VDDTTFDSPERRLYRALFKPNVTYAYTRFAILRLLGFVQLVAFASAFGQLPALIGDDGLTPARTWLRWVAREQGPVLGFVRVPTLFWFVPPTGLALQSTCALGAVLALAVTLGATNALVQLALWLLYLSIVHVGQVFYGYGWETQLLETSFLAIFLCPVRGLRPFPATRPPTIVIWLFRWLIVRIMLGAGLIKLRGDDCWTALTCLDFHFETQPIPNPASWAFHHAPRWVRHAGVIVNHVVEVGVPLFTFAPARPRHVAGVIFVAFQLTLIASGNLAFLNWLTIVPALACFDDDALRRFFPRRARERTFAPPSRRHELGARALGVLVLILSILPLGNLLSPNQAMNATYEPLGLVSSYGAFGWVGKERPELVLEGTNDDASDPNARWLAYELPCKPGDPARRPCLVSPWHYRLDWQLWFAAMSSYDEEPWIIHLVYQLLRGDRAPKALFARDPFPDAPPRFVRIVRYRYTMAEPGSAVWWNRVPDGEYVRPVAKDDPDLLELVDGHGWRR